MVTGGDSGARYSRWPCGRLRHGVVDSVMVPSNCGPRCFLALLNLCGKLAFSRLVLIASVSACVAVSIWMSFVLVVSICRRQHHHRFIFLSLSPSHRILTFLSATSTCMPIPFSSMRLSRFPPCTPSHYTIPLKHCLEALHALPILYHRFDLCNASGRGIHTNMFTPIRRSNQWSEGPITGHC